MTRSDFTTIDVVAGVIRRNDGPILISLRPNHGIDASRFFELLGRRLAVAKEALQPLAWEDLEPVPEEEPNR